MSETTSTPQDSPNGNVAWREYRALKRLLLWTIGLSCAISLSMNLADPDLWGHVRYGQELLEEGSLPQTATHTFTARGYRWINHENLAEITFALVFDNFGDEGLLIFKCLWGMAVLGLMAWVARRHDVPTLAIAVVLMLIAANLTAFFPVRPQLLSYMCLALVLVILDRAFRGWHEWLAGNTENASVPGKQIFLLAWLPLVMIAWTNSHGAFAAGLAILGTYLAGRIVEAIVYRRSSAGRITAVIAIAGGAALAATLINPYGWRLHEWLLMSLGTPRPEITEWDPPKLTDPVFVPLVLLVLTAIGSLAMTRKRRDWVQIAILALVFWQACQHVRHISLLSILCGFWLPVHFADAARRLRPTPGTLPVVRLGRKLRWGIALGLGIAIALQSSVLYFRVARLPVYRNMYPVDAIAYMAEHDMTGRLVVSFNWAQYSLAALSPQVEVSFDGRFRTCYPQEVIDCNFDFLLGECGGKRHRSEQSGPFDPHKALSAGNPNLVLIDRSYEYPIEVMDEVASQADSPWTLIYQDGIAQLWGRRDEFDNPQHPNFLPVDKRLISDHISETSVDWPALPRDSQSRTLVRRADDHNPGDENL